MRLLLPAIRADFEAIEKYRFNADQPPLDCPISVFGGLDDPRISREHLEGWALQTARGSHHDISPAIISSSISAKDIDHPGDRP